jgi:diguanylate cyclase (GGDEF)-like protein
LFNRRYLEESLSIEIERVKRTKGALSVILMDLDHFKRFNDTHGHEAGDAVFQLLGSFLQRHIRSGDVACRYGGEEFTLILPGTSVEVAQQRAQQLCEGIRLLNIDFKNQILGPLTLSIGIATFPNHGENGDLALQTADMALYQAKNEGRDRVWSLRRHLFMASTLEAHLFHRPAEICLDSVSGLHSSGSYPHWYASRKIVTMGGRCHR